MKKSWRFIGVLVLVVLFLGAVCIGVGFLTGADAERIYTVADNALKISDTIDNYTEFFEDPHHLDDLLLYLPF